MSVPAILRSMLPDKPLKCEKTGCLLAPFRASGTRWNPLALRSLVFLFGHRSDMIRCTAFG
jgi:hypothetical protein